MRANETHDLRWDQRPLRIAALQVESLAAESLQVLEGWHAMHFNVEQLLHVFGDYYFGLYDASRREARTRAYIARAHELGIKIIAYANVMDILFTLPGRAVDDWGQVTAAGKLTKKACVNAPYRDHALDSLRGLMACGADGIFLDGPHLIGDGCYCPHCAAAFRAAHGADLPKSPKDPAWPEFQEFRRQSITRFTADCHRVVHQARPDGVLYLNHFVFAASSGDGQSTRQLLPLMDWIGTEGGFIFYGFPKRTPLWKVGSHAKMLEAIAPDKPRVIFINGTNAPSHHMFHTQAETELLVASSAANAANHWYCFTVGLSDFQAPAAQTVTEINRRLEQHAAYYTATQSAAQVGLLWSQDTLEVYNEQVPESDLNEKGGKTAPKSDIPLVNEPGWTLEGLPSAAREPYESLNAAYGMLWRMQVPFDLVHDQYLDAATLARYRVILMPNAICLSDRVVALLRDYVQRGGNLIASFESSLADERGRRAGNFRLADVFGVNFEGGMKDFHHFAKMEVPPESVIGRGLFRGNIPAHRYGLVCRATTAEPLARYYGPLAESYGELIPPEMPCLYRNQFGAGACYYFNHKFFENYDHYGFGEYLLILGNMLDSLMPRQLSVQAEAETIEVSLRRQSNPNRLVLHLANYSGSHVRPIPRTVSLPNVGIGLRVDAPPVRVRELFAERELPFRFAEGRVEFTLPLLPTYAVVSIEFDLPKIAALPACFRAGAFGIIHPP